MLLDEPTKQALPDKWLADLLAKALLLEYQQPNKRTTPKGKRSGKEAHLRGKRNRACKSRGNEQAAKSKVSGSPATTIDVPGRMDSKHHRPAEQTSWQLEGVPVFHLFAQVKRLLGRVPVPIHVNNLGTPRHEEGKQVVQAAPAVLRGTSTHSQLQLSSDSSGLMHKLLSLPSFGKVVYRSTSMGSLQYILSQQHAPGSTSPKALGVSNSQQMLMQGHASLGTRPPSLDFDSQFESGNLQKAVQVSGQEYELWLSPDSSTDGHTQWYFFSIANGRAKVSYRLHIHNFRKAHSLYSQGLQPLLHSSKEASLTAIFRLCRGQAASLAHVQALQVSLQEIYMKHLLSSNCLLVITTPTAERPPAYRGMGWLRVGSSISYHQSSVIGREGPPQYTLTFTLTLPHDDDVVHLAHCYPYTYTHLIRDLEQLEAIPSRQRCMQRTELCHSLAGNSCPLITITNPSPQPHTQRPAVVFTGRVHSGESNSSWMMRGLLEMLTGPSPAAYALRDKYLFMVVPMLNPDGVAIGNYRCNLAGYDLNRVWQQPDPLLHPTIHATKALLQQLHAERGVALYCDLHGHSRKHGAFMYGCHQSPAPQDRAEGITVGAGQNGTSSAACAEARLFPFMLQQQCPDLFSYAASNFRVQRSKAGSGRVVCYQELGITNSFTLEASFAGPDSGALAGSHYDTSQLESIGAKLALALLDYSDPNKTAQAAAAMSRAVQQARQQPAPGSYGLQCEAESSGSMSDGAAADSSLSDSDAEDEGAPGTVQQQLATPAARAALTAYCIALSPNRRKGRHEGSQQQGVATCSSNSGNDAAPCSSNSHEETASRPPRASGRQQQGSSRDFNRQRSNAGRSLQLEEPSMLLQAKAGAAFVRDPAKDIARAAARSRPGSVSIASSLSLVPRVKTTPDRDGLRLGSLQAAAAAPVGPLHFSALEPVEFAIDRPPWRRTSSSGSQRQDGLVDQDLQDSLAEAMTDAVVPNSLGTPSVVTPILTTAQLDADSMEAARAITDYPWHYNFIPSARRAPTGTAGFASTSSLEQEKRRSLMFDAQQKKQALASAVARAPMSDESIPMLQPMSSAICPTRMMGYSRSLSGVAQPRGLPSLEINGHPVSLSPDRPSSAQRAIVG